MSGPDRLVLNCSQQVLDGVARHESSVVPLGLVFLKRQRQGRRCGHVVA